VKKNLFFSLVLLITSIHPAPIANTPPLPITDQSPTTGLPTADAKMYQSVANAIRLNGVFYTAMIATPKDHAVIKNIYVPREMMPAGSVISYITQDDRLGTCTLQDVNTPLKKIFFVVQENQKNLLQPTNVKKINERKRPPLPRNSAPNQTTNTTGMNQSPAPTPPSAAEMQAAKDQMLNAFVTQQLPTIVAYKPIKDQQHAQLTNTAIKEISDFRFNQINTVTDQNGATNTTQPGTNLGETVTIFVPATATLSPANFGSVEDATAAQQPYISFDNQGVATRAIINSYMTAPNGMSTLSTLTVDTTPMDRTTMQKLNLQRKTQDEVKAEFLKVIDAMFAAESTRI